MKLSPDLHNRNLLTLDDLDDHEMLALIDLAARLKRKKTTEAPGEYLLKDKNIAMIFEKASTRTRCAAVVAAWDEGARIEYLGKSDIHFGKKESVADTARVLGRMFDGILFRGFQHSHVEQLAAAAGVPVWNGLTDDAHPTQILADLLTAQEHFGVLKGLTMTFLGDGRNNVCNSLMMGCAKAGLDFVNCCPPELAPAQPLVQQAAAIAARNGCTVRIDHDPGQAVVGANIVYTDVWVSMGEEDIFDQRITLLRPYQVDMAMMARTGNLAADRVIFLHCLPAFHNRETEVTRDLGALEVTDDVFEAAFSRVFDQAENRMHTIKAMMVATLADQS